MRIFEVLRTCATLGLFRALCPSYDREVHNLQCPHPPLRRISHDQDSEKQFQEGKRLRSPFLYIGFSRHKYGRKGQATFEFSGSFRSARFFQTREGLKQMKIARHGQAEQSWMSGARTSNLPRGPHDEISTL